MGGPGAADGSVQAHVAIEHFTGSGETRQPRLRFARGRGSTRPPRRVQHLDRGVARDRDRHVGQCAPIEGGRDRAGDLARGIAAGAARGVERNRLSLHDALLPRSSGCGANRSFACWNDGQN